jgi:predicted ferric reductase
MPIARARRRITGWDVSVFVAANAVVVVGLWWRQGGIREIHDFAGLLTSLGRVTGLLGAYLALVELLLLARIPVLDALGLERMSRWHRINGVACLALLVAHTVLITAGYALDDGVALTREADDLLTRYSGVLLATIGLGLLVVVVVSSVVAVRRRLSYRVWHALHVSAYLAIALGFSHQLATGREFQGQPVARAYWWALYAVALGLLVGLRVVLPVARSLRHRLRIERVIPEAPGIVSVEIGGVELDRLRVRAGQSLHWRFLARGHWWETHPFSLSAAPDGRRLRITVKDVGDYTRRLASMPVGTWVIIEGPSGGLTSAARRHPRVALIAGGVGIAPIRALLEDMPPDTVVIYRAGRPDELVFRAELEELAELRDAWVRYIVGSRHDPGPRRLFTPSGLRGLVPDVSRRDVYLCGPPGLVSAAVRTLHDLRVPDSQIHLDPFEF